MKINDGKSWLSVTSTLPISRTCSTNLYVEDQSLSYSEQYRIIGFAHGRLATFIVEYRQDAVGEFIWVVTAWRSTPQEQKSYEQETQ